MKEQPDSAASERKTARPNLKRGGMAAGAIALAIGAGALWNGGSSPSPKADLVRTSQQAVTAAERISTSVRSFINALPTAEQDAFWQRRDLGNDPGLNGSRVNDTAHSSLELGYVRAGDLGERAVAINRALTAAERDLKTYTKGAYKATDGNGILPENPQSATLEDYRKFLHNSAERVSTLHSAVNRVAPSVEHNKDAKAALDGMQRWAIHFPGKEEIDAGVVGGEPLDQQRSGAEPEPEVVGCGYHRHGPQVTRRRPSGERGPPHAEGEHVRQSRTLAPSGAARRSSAFRTAPRCRPHP